MGDEFPAEFGLPDATELTCDECGADVDVADTTDPEEMMARIADHGKTEHGWGTDEAGRRHAVTRFGELGLDCRAELEALNLKDYEVDIYGDRWGAGIAHEEAKFSDVFRLSVGAVNTDDILSRGPHAPTRFRRELVTVVEEAHTRGATVMGLAEEFSTLSELIAQQDTETVLRWAAKGGEYRHD